MRDLEKVLRIAPALPVSHPHGAAATGRDARHRPAATRESHSTDPIKERMDMPAHPLTMTVLMTPDMANFTGNVHDGSIFKLLDEVAYTCASRHVVTLGVDQVMFRQPIHVGELIDFLASVNYVGTSSMEVGIKVVAQNILTQVARHVDSCFFTMVALDDERQPVPVWALTPSTPDEARRFEAAKLRKALRIELQDGFQARMPTGS